MNDPSPKIFYKYYPVEGWLPELIHGIAIRFSSRSTFNDPMDSRPAFRWQLDTVDGLKYAKSRLELLRLSPAERLMQLNRLKRRHSKPLDFDKVDVNAELDHLGILCLAERWDNPLLWAHYGAMHRGVCIGFHHNVDFFQQALQMHYADELPVILRPGDDDATLVKKAFLTKPSCWSYEQEWRVLKRAFKDKQQIARVANLAMGKEKSEQYVKTLSLDRGAGLYPFPPNAIESITLGMHSSADDLSMVKKAVKSAGTKVSVYKVKAPNLRYALERTRA